MLCASRRTADPMSARTTRPLSSDAVLAGDIYGHTSDATTRAAIDGLSGALGL